MAAKTGEQYPRPLYQIAEDIESDWARIFYAAIPYIDAMKSLSSVDDKYGYEDGRDIVNRFLTNANTWKGPKAKAIKAELREWLKH